MRDAAAGKPHCRSVRRACPRAAWLWGAAVGLVIAAVPARALTILPTFDPTITDSAHASTIETDIDNALAFYKIFNTTDTVSIDFQLAPSNATYLGASQTTFYFANYSDYTSALQGNAAYTQNATQLEAASHIAAGNKANLILESSADFRALGFSGAPGLYSANGAFGVGGTFDGIVYLNGQDLLGFGGAGDYDPNRTIQHEVDEVLGIGGSGSVLNIVQQQHLTTPPKYEDAADPSDPLNGDTYIGALDMFRYSSAGHPSLTTSGSATSYFSINGGVTDIAPFNQNSSGDYADWGGSGCIALVQQAFSCSGQTAQLSRGSPEFIALETVGYDLPEPAGLAVLGVALGGIAWTRRRRG